MTDLICLLIKFGYGSYEEIMGQPMHQLLEHYKWFSNDFEKEQKANRDYDIALLKAIQCPFVAMFKKR